MKPSNYLKELYRNPTDEKYTPGYGVLPIIKYIPESKIIWCPFDTEHSEFVLKFKLPDSRSCTHISVRDRISSNTSHLNGTCSCPIPLSAGKWTFSTVA